jgi:hypothetical protein
MRAKKNQPREQSVSKTPKKKKLEVEVVFGPPDVGDSTDPPANAAGATAKSDRKEKTRRVIFRL